MPDPLEREYLLLLSSAGPQILEKVHWLRALSVRCQDQCPRTSRYLEDQARRMEESLDNLCAAFEKIK